MLVTEEEAGKKLCPMWAQQEKLVLRCEGSRCMFWRWGYKTDGSGPAANLAHERTGYCGLAGKPDILDFF
jgi:hypothetical protein